MDRKDVKMFNFIMGCVIGFVVATFGLGTVVAMIDNAVSDAKEKVEETVQK